jgi:hypothetical protein
MSYNPAAHPLRQPQVAQPQPAAETFFEIPRQFRLRLPDAVQCVIDCTGLWLALMLVKVGLELLFSFLGVN